MGPDHASARRLRVDAAGLEADALTLDALARLQLTARCCGFELRLRDCGPELRELIEFAGLAEALPSDEPLGLEPGR